MSFIFVPGCTTMRMPPPVPAGKIDRAQIPGMTAVRDWGDGYSPLIEQSLVQAWEQRQRAGRPTHELAVLALSGGGTDGAYGAGLLCGWTTAGTRPDFDIVTGISTGALIAPFAFVGSTQDQKLHDFWTGISTQDFFRLRWILAALNSDAIAESEPLIQLVNCAVDADLLQAVAREHAKGRRLFVGTTNLDAQRPVIWDMGAIAASGHPDALNLFRKVMVASAAIPAVYPPQYFDVDADGRSYREMHVDGGTMAQVFHVGQMLDFHRLLARMKDFPPDAPRRLYVICNGLMRPQWQTVEPRLLPIAQRSVSTLLKAHAAADLYRIYTLARLEGADFNLAYIADDYIPTATKPLDTVDMRRLFELGFTAGKSETAWINKPPGVVGDLTYTVSD
ncbi:MAG: patatin-like phospholipase family protein [Phycisphaeraceae bacterium]|nr:patatin-like phospholipase family protein [Phycisphaeraceae bacterium]